MSNLELYKNGTVRGLRKLPRNDNTNLSVSQNCRSYLQNFAPGLT